MTKKSISILISGFIARLAIPGCFLYPNFQCDIGYYRGADGTLGAYYFKTCKMGSPGFGECMEEHGFKAHRYSSVDYLMCPNICSFQKEFKDSYFAPKGMCD